MSTASLLFQKQCKVTKDIYVRIPKVGDVIDNEREYYHLVNSLTAMPIDCMVELDDKGIDFTTIDEYQLFLMMFGSIRERDTSLIFGELDLYDFSFALSEEDGQPVLLNPKRDIRIDREVHRKIADTLRRIHHLKVDERRPANEEAKRFMIERARKKLRRRRRKEEESNLESLIVAMVNTEQFKYDYEGTRELSIYQFNESVRQITKKVAFDNQMIGVYAGTVDAKSLSPEDLNWLIHN